MTRVRQPDRTLGRRRAGDTITGWTTSAGRPTGMLCAMSRTVLPMGLEIADLGTVAAATETRGL